MIFTRRFGALAARPQFPDAVDVDQELDLDLLFHEIVEDEIQDESAA